MDAKKETCFDFLSGLYKHDRTHHFNVIKLRSVHLFRKASVLTRLNEIFSTIRSWNREDFLDISFDPDEMLVDAVLVTAAFEHWLKGSLYSQGFLVHRIEKSGNQNLEPLRSQQRSGKLINIADVDAAGAFKSESCSIRVQWTTHGISNKTINVFDHLKNYSSQETQRLFRFGDEVRDLALKYKDHRDTIHFRPHAVYGWSPDKIIDELTHMIEFFNQLTVETNTYFDSKGFQKLVTPIIQLPS